MMKTIESEKMNMKTAGIGNFLYHNPTYAKKLNIYSGVQMNKKFKQSLAKSKKIMPKLNASNQKLVKNYDNNIKKLQAKVNPMNSYAGEMLDVDNPKEFHSMGLEGFKQNAHALMPHDHKLNNMIKSIDKTNGVSQKHSWEKHYHQFWDDAWSGKVKILNSAQIAKRALASRRKAQQKELNNGNLPKDTVKKLNTHVKNMDNLMQKCANKPFMYRVANDWNKEPGTKNTATTSIYNQPEMIGGVQATNEANKYSKKLANNHVLHKIAPHKFIDKRSKRDVHKQLYSDFSNHVGKIDNRIMFNQAQHRISKANYYMVNNHMSPEDSAKQAYGSRNGYNLMARDALYLRTMYKPAMKNKQNAYQKEFGKQNVGKKLTMTPMSKFVDNTKYKFNNMYSHMTGKFKPEVADAKRYTNHAKKLFQGHIIVSKFKMHMFATGFKHSLKQTLTNPMTPIKNIVQVAKGQNPTKQHTTQSQKQNINKQMDKTGKKLQKLGLDPTHFGFKKMARKSPKLHIMHVKALKLNTRAKQRGQHISHQQSVSR